MKLKPITWRELRGNRYNRGLNLAMLHEEKYHKWMLVALRQGEKKTYCEVEYDKEYVLNYLIKKVCKPFDSLGLDALLELVREAYLCCQEEDRNCG